MTDEMTAVRAPALEGRTVRLRPIRPTDLDWLYDLSVGGSTGWRWRFRGVTPEPSRFSELLHQGVLVQHVVERPGRGPIGLVVAYQADLRNRHAHLGALFDPEHHRLPCTIEAVALFLDHLFMLWDLRKVYVEAPEFNLGQFASALGSYLEEEARLREHEFHDGRWWDQVTAALHRTTWDEVRTRLLPASHEGDAAASPGA